MATGLPCFVTTMPSESSWSRMARHFSLNFEAAIVLMTTVYQWSEILSKAIPQSFCETKHRIDRPPPPP